MTRLYRSQRDKRIFGLCGGIGEAFNIDPTILRVVFVAAAIFSGGTAILLYMVASLVIPKEPIYGGYGMHVPPYGAQPNPHSNGPHYTGGYAPNPNAYGGANAGGYAQGPNGYGTAPYDGARPQQASQLDEMMKDIEKKAMQKELEELRAKLAKYEKGE